MIKDTNPDHYKVEGANFIEYMNDPKISGFGNWMFANGFNSGMLASKNWIFTSEQMPSLNEDACSDYVLIAIKGWNNYKHIEIAYLDIYGSSSDGQYMDTPCWIEPFGGKRHTTDKVIAWMPLPEPPKEEVK